MIKNYLKITWVNLFRNPLFSFINIAGLAIGLSCSILISLFVVDELSFDRYHSNADRTYRISRDFLSVDGSDEMLLATNAGESAPLLKEDFPEIDDIARLFGGSFLLSREDIAFQEEGMQFVDPEFLSIFDFQWLAGSPQTALSEPYSIVLTQSIATKYFANENPIDQVLTIESGMTMRVTGVIEDLPANTHLKINTMSSIESLPLSFGQGFMKGWGNNNFHTYITIADGYSVDSIRSGLDNFINQHIGENASTWTAMPIMKLTDIHLHSASQNELKPPASITVVYSFSAVAICILMIACFNFMNLSTARSSLRAKEVGVRKALGVKREYLIAQFMGESLVMSSLAMMIALGLVEVCLPLFNNFIGKPLIFNIFSDTTLQLRLLGLLGFVTFFAGSYPAFYLSAFNPAQVLRSAVSIGSKDIALRNILVVLQFAVAIVLLAGTTVILLQMKYAKNINLGFNKDQVVVLSGSASGGLGSDWSAMKRELLTNPNILSATASNMLPFEANLNAIGARSSANDTRDMPYMMVDYDFFKTFDIALADGRTFSEEFSSDLLVIPENVEGSTQSNFIFNESAARRFGWSTDETVGQSFEIFLGRGFSSTGQIIGVVKDSFFESVHLDIKPQLFVVVPSMALDGTANFTDASLKLSSENLEQSLQYIDTVWQRFNPNVPLNRHFLDEDFDALYKVEDKQGQILAYFSFLSIFIACLGLYGLSSFNTQRRSKEIGVRKVMGGSVWSIVLLLTNDFSKLVLVANVLAWPIAYIAMNRWLESFAYRIDITPLVFIGSGLIALCIAWVTVGGTAAKAASQKPVMALRYE